MRSLYIKLLRFSYFLFFFLPLCLRGAITVTPNVCNYTGINSTVVSGPVAFSCEIVLTGTGAWTATVGSGNFKWVDGTGAAVASGTDAATLYLQLTSFWSTATPGTTVDNTNVIVAGQTITNTVTVVAKIANPVYLNASGIPDASLSGCTAPTEAQWFSLCTSLNAKPGGTFTFPSTPCATYTDAQFGTTIKYIAPYFMEYAGLNSISPDNQWLLTNPPGESAAGIYNIRTCAKLAHPRSFNANEAHCQWIPRSANIGYCFGFYSSTSIYKFHVTAGGVLVDDGVFWTEPHGFFIGDGGAAPPSYDGFIPINTIQDEWLYTINLTTGADTRFDLSSLVLPLAPQNPTNNTPFLLGYDSVDGKYHLVYGIDYSANMYIANRLFSWLPGATTMTFDGIGPPMPEGPLRAWQNFCTAVNSILRYACFPLGGHSNRIVAQGQVFFTSNLERSFPNFMSGIVMMKANAGIVNQAHALAVGGGLQYISPGAMNWQGGAANSPYEVMMGAISGGNTVGHGYAWDITAATGSNPITLTFGTEDPALPGATTMLCGGALGKTGINGVVIMTRIGATNQYTIPVTDAGVYTASSGACAKNVALNQTNQEILVCKINAVLGIPFCQRVAQTQSTIYSSLAVGDNYTNYPFPVVSEDGSTVCWNSAGGTPTGPQASYTTYMKILCATNLLTQFNVNGVGIGSKVRVGSKIRF